MPIGTSGFVGTRLQEAREARGLSGVDLADMLGLRPQSIYQYEGNKATPSPLVLDNICVRLNFPAAYFTRATLGLDIAPIYWRANSSATRVAQQRAEVRLTWFKEAVAYFREYFDFPAINLPAIAVPSDFRALSADQIEEAAAKCRQHWGLGEGPIPDVIAELESNGVMVARIKVGVDNLDAFSQWSTLDNTPYVMLGIEKASCARSRFDAAHELGHLLLHRGIDQKRLNTSKDWKLLEEQAHRFAAAFLLPARSFAGEIWAPSLDTFVSLKQRWRVSAAAMIMRCRYLHLINEEQERRLWINRNRRGWQKEEPLDDKIELEIPSLVPKAVEMLASANVRRKDQILLDTCLPAADLEEITGMPFGYFRAHPAPVVPLLKARQESPQSEASSNEAGVVVSLFDRVRR